MIFTAFDRDENFEFDDLARIGERIFEVVALRVRVRKGRNPHDTR